MAFDLSSAPYLFTKLLKFCVLNGISIEMKWIPREHNIDVDYLSKIIDYDDYTINDDVFRYLSSKWGPFTIDRFSCHYNAKLDRFNSRYYQTCTEAVDAFLQN